MRVELEVPGFEPSLVEEPADDGKARPVVVVTHGAGGRAEPHCDRYAARVRGRAFLLCTRGRKASRFGPEEQRGYFYPTHHDLGREAIAALGALAGRYGARVDSERVVFAGYSQGATMGLLHLYEASRVARDGAGPYGHAILVEGGYAEGNVTVGEALRRAGVGRVAIVCGQQRCIESARRTGRSLERGGLEVRVLHASGAGHTYDGAVRLLGDEAFDWIVEADPRFGAPLGTTTASR